MRPSPDWRRSSTVRSDAYLDVILERFVMNISQPNGALA